MNTPGEKIAVLETQVSGLKLELQDVRDDHEALRKRVENMERLQNWITGAASVVAFIFGLFSGEIKRRLGIP